MPSTRVGPRRRWWIGGAAVPVAMAGAVAVVLSAGVVPICGTSVASVGCTSSSLLRRALGTSVVIGSGRLAGQRTTEYGTVLHRFVIDRTRVLSGAAVPDRVSGWLETVPHPGPDLAAALAPGLWAPDGRVLALVRPRSAAAGETSTIEIWPVVRGAVVFSAPACGAAPDGLVTTPFDGPLAEVPGSWSLNVARCNGGFDSSPLRRVERLLG